MTGPRRAVVLAVLAGLCAGCGFRGIYSLPLPGAAGTGPHTYRVKVELADALDLVPYSAVKVNGATVGHVVSVSLHDRHAEVVCQLEDKVRLPANAVASLQETSLLGERFVEIDPPTSRPATGRLTGGAVIPLQRTDTSATVEEVLGSLAMLLNGGGLGQVHTIATELNRALGGREVAARQALTDLAGFAHGLDAQKTQILSALRGLDTLSATLRGQESVVTGALASMPRAFGILAQDRAGLTHMLLAMKGLGDVTTRVETAAGQDIVANLRSLQPTVARLAQVGQVIANTLQLFFTYPSPDGPECCFFGDYGNINVTIDLSRTSLLRNFNGVLPVPTGGTAPKAGRPGAPGVPRLPVPLPSPSLTVPPVLPGPLPTGTPSIRLTGTGGPTAWTLSYTWVGPDNGDTYLLFGALQ